MKDSAKRIDPIPWFYFSTLAPRIRQLEASGVDVIRLHIGSPDLPPPSPVVEVLTKAAERPDTHGYTHHKGTPELRAAWATMYAHAYGVTLDPDSEVVPLLGSKEGIFHLSQAFVDPGEVVLIPDPSYPTYTMGTLMAEGEPYFVPLIRENDFQPDFEIIPEAILNRAKILWLNYPNNPTGAVADLSLFAAALELARRYDLLVCHDAAYTQVTFDGFRARSILEIPGARGAAVEFNTLSKSHNMAGWRVGAVVGNRTALDALYRVKTHADSGHFLPIVEAATVAMTGDQSWIPTRNAIYQRRRDLVANALDDLGVSFVQPKGALYVWCACPEGWTSRQLTDSLLDGTGVSLAPGSIYGQHGEGYFRISICVPESRLAQAMELLTSWWGKNV